MEGAALAASIGLPIDVSTHARSVIFVLVSTFDIEMHQTMTSRRMLRHYMQHRA